MTTDCMLAAISIFCLGLWFDRLLLAERWKRGRELERTNLELLKSGKRPEGTRP